MEVFKKGIKSFVYHVLGSFFAVLLQFIAARILGNEEYGKANYILGFAGSISILFSFGLGFYFPKNFSNNSDNKKLFSGVLYFLSIIYILFFLFLLLFYKSDFLGYIDYILLFFVALMLILAGSLKSYYIGIHSAEKASKIGNFYLKIYIFVLFLLFYFILGKNYQVFLIAILISHILILFPFLKVTLIKSRPNYDFIKGASLFYLIQLFYSFFGEFAKVLQGDLISIKSVSLLSIALVIGSIVTIFGENFANVGLPIFAVAFKENKMKLMKEKFQEIARINAFFVLPIFFFLIYNSELILGLFGDEYKSGNIILTFILCGSFVNSFTGPNGSLLLMSGREKLELVNGIIKFLIAILFAFLFGRQFVWGIALAIAMSEIIANLLKSYEVYYYYKILPLRKKDAIYFVLLIFIELILFSFLFLLNLSIVLKIIFGLSLIILSWFITLFFSPNSSDRNLIFSLIDLFKGKQ